MCLPSPEICISSVDTHTHDALVHNLAVLLRHVFTYDLLNHHVLVESQVCVCVVTSRMRIESMEKMKKKKNIRYMR